MKYLLLVLVAWTGAVYADKIHDPTLPQFNATSAANAPVEMDISKEEIRLQGVLNRKKHKVAIISGQLYNKGDKVNGYLIADIKNDHVLLLSSGSRKRIYVYE
tara:strand:- start:251 stop:559 length:309 start_codon:yes stop_codon:yes gene_type:complete